MSDPIAPLLILPKLDKSKEVKFSHPLNIPPKSTIDDVSNLDKFNDVRELQ